MKYKANQVLFYSINSTLHCKIIKSIHLGLEVFVLIFIDDKDKIIDSSCFLSEVAAKRAIWNQYKKLPVSLSA